MEFRELIECGLSFPTVYRLLSASEPVQRLIIRGLPMKTIRGICDTSEPCASKGTTHRRQVADLRSHHVTQESRLARFAAQNPTAAARKASRDLKEQRYKMMNVQHARLVEGKSFKSIDHPDCTKGKRNTPIRRPREAFQPTPSRFSSKVDENDPKAEENIEETEEFEEKEDFEEAEDFKETRNFDETTNFGETSRLEETQSFKENQDFKEMEEYFDGIRDVQDRRTNEVGTYQDVYINASSDDGEVKSEIETTEFAMEAPDDYDIEMAKTEDDQSSKELLEEEPKRLTKRQWEAVVSPESPNSDPPGNFAHDGKRRKLARGTNSSQVSQPGLRKKGRKEKSGKLDPCNVFCRSTNLAAVFGAAIAVGALETPQEDNSDGPELNSLDRELLGEEPSDFKQTQTSANQDAKAFIAETLYATVSHDELRVSNAAANLLGIHQGNSHVSELDTVDREALQEAFGEPMQPSAQTVEEPSPFVEVPRTVKFSERYEDNKLLMRRHEHKFKRHDKRIGPSEEFQSFFATRRLRKDLLRKGELGAGLGVEITAKSLLDGRKSPLRKLVRYSRKSDDERRRKEFERPEKQVSRKQERMLARIARSGLSTLVAED